MKTYRAEHISLRSTWKPFCNLICLNFILQDAKPMNQWQRETLKLLIHPTASFLVLLHLMKTNSPTNVSIFFLYDVQMQKKKCYTQFVSWNMQIKKSCQFSKVWYLILGWEAPLLPRPPLFCKWTLEPFVVLSNNGGMLLFEISMSLNLEAEPFLSGKSYTFWFILWIG